MLSYCLKCRKNTESKKPQVVKTKKPKNNAFIKMWKCAMSNSKKLKFIKEQLETDY